jgi:hypothetical protein
MDDSHPRITFALTKKPDRNPLARAALKTVKHRIRDSHDRDFQATFMKGRPNRGHVAQVKTDTVITVRGKKLGKKSGHKKDPEEDQWKPGPAE